jgi:cell division protein FtsB
MPRVQRPFFQRLFQSKLTVIFEVLVLVLISAALAKEIARRYQIHAEIKKLENTAASLEQRNTELGGLLNQLSNSAYREEQARLKLGLQKPGESVVVVMGESTDNPPASTNATPTTAPEESDDISSTASNPQKWWDYFFPPALNKESAKT